MQNTTHTTRTVKVRLNLDEAQRTSVLNTMTVAKAFYDHVVRICCVEQCANYYTLATPERYAAYRKEFPTIPSMLVQQLVKEACASVKAWNSKHKDKRWQCPSKRSAMSYPLNKRTLSRRGDLTSLITTSGRIRTLCPLPSWFVTRYAIQQNDVQAGTVRLTQTGLWLCLVYKIPVTHSNGGTSIGIDRGLYNLCTLSDGTIHSSKRATAVKRRYQYLRSKLQQKGTRSAKRHLKALSGKEKRFMSDFNHCVTKALASRDDVQGYVLEDLSGIRKARRGRKLNSWLGNWSYYQFELQLTYKCEARGISVTFVDPRYTSQKCSCCGVIDKEARSKSRYACSSCGHKDHADVNAAKNIRDNYARSKAGQGVSTAQSYRA